MCEIGGKCFQNPNLTKKMDNKHFFLCKHLTLVSIEITLQNQLANEQMKN